MKRNRIPYAFPLLLLLASFALAEPSGDGFDYKTVLEGLSDVAWAKTPNDVVRAPDPKLSVVWLGRVEAVDVSEGLANDVTLEFLCRHLEFVDPNARALGQEPFRARDRNSGYFVISISAPQMPADPGRKLQDALVRQKHFAVVGGHPVAIRKTHGKDAVVLNATKAHMSDKIQVILEPPARRSTKGR